MLEIAEIFINGRVLERTIVACSGLISIILGFFLFKSYKNSDDNGEKLTSADIKFLNFSAKFWDVGPGVFFSLFGAFILITSLNSKVNVQELRSIEEAARGPILADNGGVRSQVTGVQISGFSGSLNNERISEIGRSIVDIESVLQRINCNADDCELSNRDLNMLNGRLRVFKDFRSSLLAKKFCKSIKLGTCDRIENFRQVNMGEMELSELEPESQNLYDEYLSLYGR